MVNTLLLKIREIDSDKRIYLIAILLSLFIHLFFLFYLDIDFFTLDFEEAGDDTPEEVTIVFPENRPKTVVENINENDAIPDFSDLLSNFNSRARNPEFLDQRSNQPMSEGNMPFPNLTQPSVPTIPAERSAVKKFSRDALIQDKQAYDDENIFAQANNDRSTARQQPTTQQTTNNIFNQDKFSADELGDFSLSTYAWEWAPYLNELKKKLMQFWQVPVAYRMGLISGMTAISFTITRDGQLLGYEVLGHEGHESLQISSVNVVNAIFPFKPLPSHFPDETLTVTAKLFYPDWRKAY